MGQLKMYWPEKEKRAEDHVVLQGIVDDSIRSLRN